MRLSKGIKSSVTVKSNPGATKGMNHHVKEWLEDNSPDSVILHVGTNNLKNTESIEDIAKDLMDLALYIRNGKTNLFVSGLTVEMID